MKKKDVLKKTVKKSPPKKSAKVDKKEEEDLLPKAVSEHITEFNSSMEKKNLPFRAEWDKHNKILIKNTKFGNVLKKYMALRNRKELLENPGAQVIYFRQLKEKNGTNLQNS